MSLAAVKFVDGSDEFIEGLAIPFGGPIAGKDLDGEAFGPDTDFALDWFPQGRPLTYQHGLDPAVRTKTQGRQVESSLVDEGIWARAQLDKSAKYHATVSRMIAAGKLFFSSGSLPHLVEADPDGHIKRWPWVELALTPTPANPYATLRSVKTTDLIERLAAIDMAVPAPLIAAALKALDSTTEDDDGLPAGSSFADQGERLLLDVSDYRDRVAGVIDVRAKSGRVLSQTTRERLLRHPSSLRELADDLEGLLSEADAEKSVSDPALDQAVAETLRRAAVILMED